MLAGGLSGAPCSRPEIGPRTGNAVLFVLLAPDHFFGATHFRTEVATLAANVRATPPAQPGGAIQLPGDPERRAREQRLREGIALDDGTWGQLADLAGRLGVLLPSAIAGSH
jgi:uncharacterized oxidoreductase